MREIFSSDDRISGRFERIRLFCFCLSATSLGKQCVIRTENALRHLAFIHQNYLSKPEKEDCIKQRLEMNNLNQDKVSVARMQYRGKGRYIEELLK